MGSWVDGRQTLAKAVVNDAQMQRVETPAVVTRDGARDVVAPISALVVLSGIVCQNRPNAVSK